MAKQTIYAYGMELEFVNNIPEPEFDLIGQDVLDMYREKGIKACFLHDGTNHYLYAEYGQTVYKYMNDSSSITLLPSNHKLKNHTVFHEEWHPDGAIDILVEPNSENGNGDGIVISYDFGDGKTVIHHKGRGLVL